MSSELQAIIGLIIGVVILVFLVVRTKVHAFPALIIAAAIVGLAGGLAPADVAEAITAGFGDTLAVIGLVIGFAVMLGKILEAAGASERLAYSFLRLFGRRREEPALAFTGYVVSIPVFVDSAFVILTPLARALSARTGKSVIALGVALGIGLTATHHAVPPTPGPLAVAGIFGVDVGLMILWGLVLSIPLVLTGVVYARWIGNRIYQLPDEDSEEEWYRPEETQTYSEADATETDEELPSLAWSLAPILIPIVLIFGNTTLGAFGLDSGIFAYVQFLGNPVIAVGLGLIIAIYGLYGHASRRDALDKMEEGLRSAGIILVVTGSGGALGNVLRQSGAGDYIGELIAGTGLPAIMLPFVIASIVRLIQGSGTVAMITGASISAPIVAGLDVNMVLAAQAATLGAMVFSYFNDSLFWVVNRMLGIKDVKEQILVWSVPTTIIWAVAFVELMIASALFGSLFS